MSVVESEPNNEESLAGSDSHEVGDKNTAKADQLEPEENNQEDSEKGSEGSPEEAEIASLKDQLLRNAAEFENLKRRTFRDVENAHKFGTERLIDDLLPVLDSLEKAIEAAGDVEVAKAIGEGVELSLKLFMDSLVKNGLEVVDPLGEPFDPNLHEALAAVPNENAEPNNVMEVIQKGFTLNGRLVRAAKVIVAKEMNS